MTVMVWSTFGQNGGTTLASNSGPGSLGMQFSLSTAARVTGIWFYSPSGATNLPLACGIYIISSQALIIANENPTWSGAAGSGWIKCSFDGAFPLQSGIQYKVVVYSSTLAAFYSDTSAFWSSGAGSNGVVNGIITAPNNATAVVAQCTFDTTGGGITFPGTSGAGDNYWVDVEVTTGLPSPQPPIAGFGLESPRTWSAGDQVTTPRLRGDVYNIAALNTQARPLFFGSTDYTLPNNSLTVANRINANVDSWNVFLTEGAALGAAQPGTANFWSPPLPGWYLVNCSGLQAPVSGGTANTLFSAGIIYTQGTALIGTRTDTSQVYSPSAGTFSTVAIGNSSGDLIPFTPASGDSLTFYSYNLNATGSVSKAHWFLEWVGMPSSSSLTGVPYTGPVGTVVASPKPATLWPPGPGVPLQGSVSAGGTVLVLPPTPGLRAGQTIGIDWQGSQQSQAYGETATVASIAGGTVTLSSALSYAHSAGAPVAVPVSAPLLNEQVRDLNNFAFYPPLLRVVQGTAQPQAIANSTWTTVSLGLTGSGVTNTIDNFNSWATVTANSYTIPVSGVYTILGQVYMAGNAVLTTWQAALLDNLGNRYIGDTYVTHNSGGGGTSPAVRRTLRLVAGQTIALQVQQNSGSSVNTRPIQTFSAGTILLILPRLIVVFRTF